MLMASCIHPLTDLATDIYPPPPVDHIYEPINMGEQVGLLYKFPWSNAFLSWTTCAGNRPFPSSLVMCLCFKASLSAKPLLWKWLWFASKWSCMQNHFHMKGFALRLVLKQRHKRTRKWPIRTMKDEQFTTRLISCFSFQKTYKTKVPYDPEGALGTLTSAFLVFLGVQVWLSLVVRLLPTSVNWVSLNT